MGGTVPFGYQVKDRKLEIVEEQAKTVRLIFETYAELGTVEALLEYLIQNGITNQRDHTAHQAAGSTTDQSANQPIPTAFSRAALHHMLKNPLYIGKTTHKGTSYEGMHEAIIEDALWTKVQQQIADNTNNQTSGRRSKHPSLLVGRILTDDGHMLTPTHTVKRGVRYRYYANFKAAPKSKIQGNASSPIIRIPAAAIERLVTDRLLTLLQSQTELATLLNALNLSASQLQEVIQKAEETADQWSSKSAADQRAVLQAVLNKVRLRNDHVELQLSRSSLLRSLLGPAALNSSHIHKSAEHPSVDPEDDIVCILTTNCLEHSGNGLRLIINDTNQASPNVNLAPLLGEAFMLREELLNGPHESIEAMSKALQTTNGTISARIRLTYLSPSLIKKILSSDIPNLHSPTRLIDVSKDLPVKWAAQDRFIEALAR
jgi:site-specific DNA recombinase